MFLNPWYGGERPPTANGGAVLTQQQQQSPQHCTQQTQHSPLSSTSHSPHSSPTPGHRITLSQSSNSPSPSPTLLPRSSFLHSHLAHLISSSAHNSSTTTTSSSNTSSPVLGRASNNNSSYSPSNSPRLGRNFNTFNTPHCLQTTINISSSNTLGGHVPSNNSSPQHNSHPPNSFPTSIINNPSQHISFSNNSSNSSSVNSTTSSHLTLLNNTLPKSFSVSGGGIHSTFTNLFSSSPSGLPLPGSGLPSGGMGVVRTVQGAPPLHVLQNLLDILQMKLRPGWTVHCTTDGRYFYCK